MSTAPAAPTTPTAPTAPIAPHTTQHSKTPSPQRTQRPQRPQRPTVPRIPTCTGQVLLFPKLAIKVVELKHLHFIHTEDPLAECSLLEQISPCQGQVPLLRTCKNCRRNLHPGRKSVMQLLDSRRTRARLLMLFPKAGLGDLFFYVKKHGFLSPRTALRIASHVALGLDFLHQHGIAHLDLSPENVLLDSAGFAQITDLGQATTEPIVFGRHGKKVYAAPEAWYATKEGFASYPADLWSLGVVLFIMLVGSPPWRAAPLSSATGANFLFRRMDQITTWVFSHLLCPPHQRWTAREAARHLNELSLE